MRRFLLIIFVLVLLDSQALALTPTWLGRTLGNAVAAKSYQLEGVQSGDTDATRSGLVPQGGTLKSITIWASAAPNNGGGTQSWIVTVYKNGAATALTVTISEAETTKTTTTDVTVAADDNLSVYIDDVGTPTAASLHWAITYAPTTDGEQWFANGYVPSLGTGATGYYVPCGYMTSESTPAIVISTPGTISHLHGELSAAPGTGKSWHFYVTTSAGQSNVDRTVPEAGTSFLDDTNSVSVSAGDFVRMDGVPSNTPAASSLKWGFVFTPMDTSVWILSACSKTSMATGADSYQGPVGFDSYSATESPIQQYVPALSILNAYAILIDSPGVGKSYTTTLRDDGADTSPALQIVIADSATAGNATANVSIAAGSLLDTEVTPAGTPTARAMRGISYTIETAGGGGAGGTVIDSVNLESAIFGGQVVK